MTRGGGFLRAVVGTALVIAVVFPGRADAAPSFQAVILPQAQLMAGGAGMVVHFKVECTPSTSGFPDLYAARVDQVTGPKTVQREVGVLAPICDGAWHKVSAAVPVPSPGTDEETSSDNVAPRAWQPTTALVRVENSFSDPEIFVGGVVQVQRGPAPSTIDPALTIAANARRIAAGAGTRLHLTVVCPTGNQEYVSADFAQVLSKSFAERGFGATQIPCTGSPQPVDVVVPAFGGRTWQKGTAFVDAQDCDQVCHQSWRAVRVFVPAPST